MRQRSWATPFILAAVLAAAFLATNGAAHAAAPDVRQERLTRIASKVLGGRVLVTSHAFGCPGLPVRRCTDMTAGEAYAFEDGSRLIQLAPDIVRALNTRRILPWTYGVQSSTGDAIFTLAHEIGHLKSPNIGEWEEAKADCYAARTWRGLALRLGFNRSQLPALARQVTGSCWGPTRSDL